jgi:hypothetical protein
MLFLDLMFWKTPAVAEQVKQDYFLRGDSDGLFTWKQVRRPAPSGPAAALQVPGQQLRCCAGFRCLSGAPCWA